MQDTTPEISTNKKSPSTRLRITVTVSYLLCIYSTLGIARSIANLLRTMDFLLPLVILLFVIITPLALGWRYSLSDRKQMVLRVALIASLVSIAFFVTKIPEERLHFLTYGLLGWMICWSLESMQKPLLSAINSCLLSCLLVWLAGGIDELIQWWLPMRVFDVRDIIFNGVAGMMGVAIFATGRSREHYLGREDK